MKKLPWHVEQLDFVIMRRCGVQYKYYEFYVKRQHVMDALLYKIQMDKYYRDDEIGMDLVVALPETPTNVSNVLQYVDSDVDEIGRVDEEI